MPDGRRVEKSCASLMHDFTFFTLKINNNFFSNFLFRYEFCSEQKHITNFLFCMIYEKDKNDIKLI